ncbi:MAG: MotA/TolQ/ExbB proton channel family protein [Planctomycetes bacterium]|nr:MotA/TolQ/ExbB proton channel family protein [Planctomycetota bacterium]
MLNPQDTPVLGTVGEFFLAGGSLMWPILGCSIVTAGLALERWLSLRAGRVLPQVVVDAVEQCVQGRPDVIEAGILEADAPAARVLAAGLKRRGYPLGDVEKAMEDKLQAEAAKLKGNVRGIFLMASVAPLLGLLGTVLGIADAFAAVEQTGLGKAESSEALAGGIKVALYTTIFGLYVAVPATVVGAWLTSRARKLAVRMGDAVAPAIEALAAKPQAPAPTATAPAAHPGGTHAA